MKVSGGEKRMIDFMTKLYNTFPRFVSKINKSDNRMGVLISQDKFEELGKGFVVKHGLMKMFVFNGKLIWESTHTFAIINCGPNVHVRVPAGRA